MNTFKRAQMWGVVRRLLTAATACGLLFAAGCSGVTPTLTNSSLVRFINACPNGGSAVFSAGATSYGAQPFFMPSSVYPYFTVAITAPFFSFGLTGEPGVNYPVDDVTLVAGHSYSVIVMGRADVVSGDARYPQIQAVQDDKTVAPSGDVRLRIMNVAPDLTSMDATVNATPEASAALYPSFGSYFNVVTGNLTIVASQTGGSQVASTTFTHITAGHLYTAFVVETDPAGPTYAVELLDDTTDALVT